MKTQQKSRLTWTLACLLVSGMLTADAWAADHGHGHGGHGHDHGKSKDEKQAEKETKAKPQTVCPIMGGKINKKQFVDVKGKRIYVCCPGCFPAIKKDPDAALKKIADRGEEAEDVIEQKVCPVMGGKINKDLFVEHEGSKIYVCCKGCLDPIKMDPAKYAKKVAEQIAADKAEDKDADKEDGQKEKKALPKSSRKGGGCGGCGGCG